MSNAELHHPLLPNLGQQVSTFEKRSDLIDEYYLKFEPYSAKVRSFPEASQNDPKPIITNRKIDVGVLSPETTGLNKWADLAEIDISFDPEGNITGLNSFYYTYYPDSHHHYLLSYKQDEKNPATATLTRVADVQTEFKNGNGLGKVYTEEETIAGLKLPENLCPKSIDWIGTTWMYSSGFAISGERKLTGDDIRKTPLIPAAGSPFMNQETIFSEPPKP